jgi:hypothetical protein
VTTPAPPQQVPPGQQPPPPPAATGAEAALVTAVAGQLLTAVSAAAALAAIVAQFRLKLDMQRALAGSLGIAMQSPPPVTGVVGPASAQTSRQNLARRAQFVVSAAGRLMSDLAAWRAKHTGHAPAPPESAPGPEPPPGPAVAQAADLNVLRRGQFTEAKRRRLQGDIDAAENAGRMRALQDGLARERRYYGMHLDAMWQRATAAGKTDMAALEHGRLLGWNTVVDSRASAECLGADHHNYYADQMPDIGWPGGGPHPNCRCFPGPPWPGAPLLPSRAFARAA